MFAAHDAARHAGFSQPACHRLDGGIAHLFAMERRARMGRPAVSAGSIWTGGGMAEGIFSVGLAARVAAGTGTRARLGTVGFRVAGEVAGAATVLGTDPVGCGVLLGLQEGESDGARDRAAKTRAREVMTELAMLQRDILRGAGVSRANLRRLKQLGEAAPDAADSSLRALLSGIVLRARVEWARYEASNPK